MRLLRRRSVLTVLGEFLKRGSNRHPRDFFRGKEALPAPGPPLLALRVSQQIRAFDRYEPLPDLAVTRVLDLLDDTDTVMPALAVKCMHARLICV